MMISIDDGNRQLCRSYRRASLALLILVMHGVMFGAAAGGLVGAVRR